jgi:hypothetical protein
VVKGEIRIADRAYLQPEQMATVLDAGADLVVRGGWKGANWRDGDGRPLDLLAEFRQAQSGGLIDQPICIACKSGRLLKLRLVAVRKPEHRLEAARRQARHAARKGGHTISTGTLDAAEWVILITSLTAKKFPTDDILALYRLRWRIELAFKRLKSVIGLKRPPGVDERSARPYILAHLLMILLLEPLIDEFEVSPRLAAA